MTSNKTWYDPHKSLIFSRFVALSEAGRRARRAFVMRNSVVAAALVMSLYGCGSGNNVTAPTPTPTPIPNVNVNGSWVGTLDRGIFSGTCVASTFQQAFDPAFPLRLVASTQQATGSAQVAATATISIGGRDLGSGGFVGLSEMNTVTIDAPQPILLSLFGQSNSTVPCSNNRVVRLSGGTTRLRGDATATTWSGDYTESIQVSGDDTGVLTLAAHFNLTR
jgi:hypothetical protein